MAYSPYQPERRPKSRRWLLIALSLTVVVVLIVFLASRQTDQRGTVEFFGATEEAVVLQESAAQTFDQALASIGVVSRQDLTRRLDTVEEKTLEAEGLVTTVENVPCFNVIKKEITSKIGVGIAAENQTANSTAG